MIEILGHTNILSVHILTKAPNILEVLQDPLV
jgi:hypothetical protein